MAGRASGIKWEDDVGGGISDPRGSATSCVVSEMPRLASLLRCLDNEISPSLVVLAAL